MSLSARAAQGAAASERSAPIRLDQLGAVATKQVEGDCLSITAIGNGARLRCSFQRLEGQASPEGLWLTSTAKGATGAHFRLVAVSVGRGSELSTPPLTGTVSVEDQLVRFIRPGLTEEYSVSVDGVRQDFVIAKRPVGAGDLRVELALNGAQAEPTAMGSGTATGAKLTLDGSGRTLAYSRLRATDAMGRELRARMEVLTSNSESKKQKAETSRNLRTSAATRAGLVVVVDDADATYPIRIDPTISDADWVSMNSLSGADLIVSAFAVDANGNLYVAGGFTAIGTIVGNHIAKWNGSKWSVLGSGMNGNVDVLTVSGTDLYAGGDFTTAGGASANRIAKWDGSAWSALGSGVDGSEVRALVMMGTNLYAGGRFTAAGGVTVNHVAKWNGSSWSALGAGISGVGSWYAVMALAVMGTDLYVGGDFTTAGGMTVNHIARWNGSAWSALGSGTSGGGAFGGVMALAVTGTDLYVGGDFTSAGGVGANDIAKWNGSNWSPVGSGMGPVKPGAMSWVWSLALMGTDLYAGGFFGTAGGVSAYHLAKWNGSTWAAIGSEMAQGWRVNALAVIGGDLYVGGSFDSAGGVTALNIARYDGASWSAMGSGMGGPVWALAVMGTDLYVGGSFPNAPDGVPANNLAKWDGTCWSALGSGMNGRVTALAVLGSDLYAAGEFTTAGGVPAIRIARWNGSTWFALGQGLGTSMPLYDKTATLAVAGTDLYVGGFFTTAGGIPANGIARWNGTSWSALGSGLSGGLAGVLALATRGTDLYVGGYFTTAGGVAANSIAKWNGSTWSALGAGVDGIVHALATAGTDLYAGGGFMTAGGVPAHGIAKWDGSVWSALDSGPSSEPQWHSVHALAACGSDLYAGGNGYLDESTSYLSVAWWNGTQWSALGSGWTMACGGLGIETFATDDAGHLFIGGCFYSVSTTVSPYVIQANIAGLDFTWDAIASPQRAGVPIPVTLTARNAAGDIRTNFTDTVNLSGYAPGLATTNFTIGTGTAAWGYPLYTLYHDARTQVIYPATELGQACTINSLALDVTTAPGQTLEHWTIRMRHTALAEYSALPSWEGTDWTVVCQTNEPAGTTGWRTFVFNTPFEYNGTDNLLVDFSFNNSSYSAEGQCQSTIVGAYRSIIHASDSKDGDPLTWSGTSPAPTGSYNVPNVVLGASYPDLLPVSLSPTVTTPFVDGVWTGEVTVHEAATNLVLRADDGLGHGGESNPFDVQASPPALKLVMSDDPFSFTNGCYGFAVQGQAGQVVVIEASTNLVHWLPIHTNLMGDLGQCLFHDLHTGQFPRRCYRARLYEGALPPPALLSGEAAMVGAQFRLAVGAVGGQEVVVEASTDLVEWQPIQTNTVTIGPCHFYDPDMTNFTERFYRAVTMRKGEN